MNRQMSLSDKISRTSAAKVWALHNTSHNNYIYVITFVTELEITDTGKNKAENKIALSIELLTSHEDVWPVMTQ